MRLLTVQHSALQEDSILDGFAYIAVGACYEFFKVF